jgi:hypothetical protein
MTGRKPSHARLSRSDRRALDRQVPESEIECAIWRSAERRGALDLYRISPRRKRLGGAFDGSDAPKPILVEDLEMTRWFWFHLHELTSRTRRDDYYYRTV